MTRRLKSMVLITVYGFSSLWPIKLGDIEADPYGFTAPIIDEHKAVFSAGYLFYNF